MSTIVCTICARGGSKGVPGKNTRLLAGKPLLAHSIQHAKDADLFSHIAVSSDDDAILEVAKRYGADYGIKRPADMATDTAGKVPAITHALRMLEQTANITADILVDLDATSPLRLPSDIVQAVELLQNTQCTSVITGTPAHRSPYFNLVERQENGTVQLSKPLPQGVMRRQDSPACFDMNASIYVWNRNTFLADPRVFYPDTRLYEMPRERSHDIDEPLDFSIVEMILNARSNA